jgi:hypothetical protein
LSDFFGDDVVLVHPVHIEQALLDIDLVADERSRDDQRRPWDGREVRRQAPSGTRLGKANAEFLVVETIDDGS